MKNKNYMSELADMLGVVLGEEFNIEGFSLNPCKITKDGLIDGSSKKNIHIVDKLLTGEAKIIKKPWTPQLGKRYFYISVRNHDEYFVAQTSWADCSFDKGLYYLGNFFSTGEEAEEYIDAYRKFAESLTPNMSWRERNKYENY